MRYPVSCSFLSCNMAKLSLQSSHGEFAMCNCTCQEGEPATREVWMVSTFSTLCGKWWYMQIRKCIEFFVIKVYPSPRLSCESFPLYTLLDYVIESLKLFSVFCCLNLFIEMFVAKSTLLFCISKSANP